MYSLAAFALLWLPSLVGAASLANTTTDPDLTSANCPDYCAGTNSTGNSSLHICGDPRLGPVSVPTGLPLSGIAGSDSTYHRFGGLCPGEFLASWTGSTGAYAYPPYAGYQLTTSGQPAMFNLTLPVGTFLDRFGSEFGAYMSPAGVPYAQRALPPTNLDAAPGAMYPYNYRVYMVTRPLHVQGGIIAGWFEQQGLGVQFLVPSSVMKLVDDGFLSRINLTADPRW